MKKLCMLLTLVLLMAMASYHVKAQEITIVLKPGWNWIAYTNAEVMDIATALGDFTPAEGDAIKSQTKIAKYINGRWKGNLRRFTPGIGYHYYSTRIATVRFVFYTGVTVTTSEPTSITTTSAVCGGTVAVGDQGHVFARGFCWSTHHKPTYDDNHTSDGTDIGSFNHTLEGLNSNTVYYVRAYVASDGGLNYGDEKIFTTLDGGGSNNDHEYVDLGLPSGTLWATCNVGANSPEGYGDHFAWAETQPKDTYSWTNYQYCNGSSSMLTKYCNDFYYGYDGFVDNLTYLQSSDDAATVNWGEDWRMPTKGEWQELYSNTTCTWVSQNGVNGRLFTASNGNSLFIPAAGYGDLNGLNATGNMGDYWSRTLNPSFPYYAYGFYFDSGGFTVYDSYREGGLCVRPVRAQPQGAINGLFSVSDTRKVYFSQGNLQYQASTNTWRFAENQWDYVGTHTPENNEPIGGTVSGSDNHNISSTYNGWIDLFGWGTSGYHDSSDSYNVNYQPWSTSWSTVNENYNYYGYGPSTNMSSPNLTGSSANYDWGVYNPISDGGNTSNQWRTLTQSEWSYVFFDRATVSGIRYAKAKVNNVNGVILLPDNWSNSIYSLSDTNTEDASFNSNALTISEWAIIEDAGAVFLPAASTRSGSWIYNVGSVGNYWSTSYCNSDGACIVYFNAYCFIININAGSGRFGGCSVRLVQDAE